MELGNTWKQIGLAIICSTLLSMLAGCADLQGALTQTTAWRNNAKAVESELQSQLNTLQLQRETESDTSQNAASLDAAISLASAEIQTLNTAIAQADLVIQEATNPTDSITLAADAISPWVPAPAQGPLLLGAALIASLMRSRNLKQNTASIINSIDHLIKGDPQFKELFAQHANTIRTIQTPGARKLIDSTSRKLKK